MALMPAYFTMNRMSRKRKCKTAGQLAAEAEHRRFLASHGITGKPVVRLTEESKPREEKSLPPTSDTIPTGVAILKEPNVYSGEQKLIGIATMHKSNMVPVFSQKSAEEISRMRR